MYKQYFKHNFVLVCFVRPLKENEIIPAFLLFFILLRCCISGWFNAIIAVQWLMVWS